MKIAIAVGIILNAGVLSVIAYQQNQQTAEQGSQVVALLKQLERPEPVQEPEEDPLAGKIDKLVALAERADKREGEQAKAAQLGTSTLAEKVGQLVALAERSEKQKVEGPKVGQEDGVVKWEYGILRVNELGRDLKTVIWWETGRLQSRAGSGDTLGEACLELGQAFQGLSVPLKNNQHPVNHLTGILGANGWDLVQVFPEDTAFGSTFQEFYFKRKRRAP